MTGPSLRSVGYGVIDQKQKGYRQTG